MIQTLCPHCGKEFRLPPDVAGRKIKCNGCSEKFRLPGQMTSGASSTSAPIAKDRPIETRCPRCLADYTLKPKYVGETVRCKTCRTPFVVPNPNAPEPEPDLDDLVDVTPVLPAAKIAPAKSSPRPATPRRPEPEVVELTEDDMIDGSSTAYDLFGDADEMRSASRRGANRPAPLPRMTYEPEEPTFTPPKIRKASRKSESGFGDHLKAIGSGVLSIVVCCSLAYLKYERRRMRNERVRNAVSADSSPETRSATVTPRPEPRQFPGPSADTERVRNAGQDLARKQMERLRQERQSRPSLPRNSGFGPGGPPGFSPGGPPGFSPGGRPGFGPGGPPGFPN